MDILKVLLEKGKIVWFLALRYFCTCWAWMWKLVSIQIQKAKQASVNKKMEKSYTQVGKDLFLLYQEDQMEIMESPTIQQQLEEIQESLDKKNSVLGKIGEIEEQYVAKVTKAKEKYNMRRGIVTPQEMAEESQFEEEMSDESYEEVVE